MSSAGFCPRRLLCLAFAGLGLPPLSPLLLEQVSSPLARKCSPAALFGSRHRWHTPERAMRPRRLASATPVRTERSRRRCPYPVNNPRPSQVGAEDRDTGASERRATTARQVLRRPYPDAGSTLHLMRYHRGSSSLAFSRRGSELFLVRPEASHPQSQICLSFRRQRARRVGGCERASAQPALADAAC